MTNQVRVTISAEDQGGKKALDDLARGLEATAVAAEKSSVRQANSFAKVRGELQKADIAIRRSSAETARQREEDSKKTLAVLVDDALRAQRIQRKSALDSAAVFVAAERQKMAAVEQASQQSRETLARSLKQREADNARSIEVIRQQNEAARKAETAAAVAEIRRRRAAEVAESVAASRAQRQINAQFFGSLSGKSAADSGAVFGASFGEQEARARADAAASQRAAAAARSQREQDNARSIELLRRRNAQEIAEEQSKFKKLGAIQAAAYAEDLARQRAADAAKVREAQRASAAQAAARGTGAAGSFFSGVGAAAGVGFGAGPLGAGIATALGVGFSSLQAIEFERANAALTAVTGSSTEAGQALAFVRDQAERLGVSVTTLSLQYSRFEAAAKGTALEGGRTRDIFLAITEAGQRLNLRSEQVEGALNAVSQIISKGSVQAEELRGQLGDRLPGAFNIMARALGVTTRELDKMLRTGDVLASDALPKFAAELRRTFDTDANTRINTTVSNFTRLTNEIRLAAASFGQLINSAAGPAAGALARALEQSRLEGEASRLGALQEFNIRRSADERAGRTPQSLDDFLVPIRGFADRRKNALDALSNISFGSLSASRALVATDPQLPGLTGARGVSARTGLTGEALLTAGQPALDSTEFRNSTRQRLEAQGKVNELTQLEIFLQRQAAGEFAGKNALIVENYRQIAIAEDENNKRLKAERESKRGLTEEEQARVRELKAALAVEEQQREEAERAIRANEARAEVLREEVRLGRELTAVERARITARVNATSTAGRTVAGSEDDAAAADRDNRLAQSLRAFRLGGAQRAGEISFDTRNLTRNDIAGRISNEQRQIELEARRLLVGATEDQTAAILAEADAQMKLVEALLTQQDVLSRDAVTGARRTLQQIERDSTNAATLISEAITQGFRAAEEAAARFATTGKFSIRDFVSSALADFARLSAQRGISSLFSLAGNALLGSFGGGGVATGVPSNFTGGGFGSGNGLQFLGGPRADGGATYGGGVYPVVERGAPEAFRTPRGDTYLIPPAQGGKVVPMPAAGEVAQPMTLTLNIDARGATDPVAIQRAGKAAQRAIAATLARRNSRGIALAD